MKRLIRVLLLCAWWLSSQTLVAEPQMFFTGDVRGNADLFRLQMPAMRITQLTTQPSNEMQAAVSPDGTKLAFISDCHGANSLFLLEVAKPAASWTELSIGMGAHANPAFSPDGKKLALSYAPDPEAPLQKTKLMILDIETRTATVALDSQTWEAGNRGASAFMVVDRPQWLDGDNLVFAAILYSDAEAMRITSSGIHRLHLGDGKTVHLAGGESYFDEKGAPRGYRATMPRVCGEQITYVAVEGQFRRTPMTMTFDGRNKKVLPIQDGDFFGPVFPHGREFIYGYQDQDGKNGLALQTPPEKNRRVISFGGTAHEPMFLP